MKSCPNCGKSHSASHPHFKLKDKLTDKGFPTHAKKYASAHEAADKAEKNKFGVTNYNKLKREVRNTPAKQLLGKNTRRGEIEVSSKVPSKLRSEVAFHEKRENELLRKKK